MTAIAFTSHAIQRFHERHVPHLSRDRASDWLTALGDSAKKLPADSWTHGDRWLVKKPRMILVTKDDETGPPVCVTVLQDRGDRGPSQADLDELCAAQLRFDLSRRKPPPASAPPPPILRVPPPAPPRPVVVVPPTPPPAPKPVPSTKAAARAARKEANREEGQRQKAAADERKRIRAVDQQELLIVQTREKAATTEQRNRLKAEAHQALVLALAAEKTKRHLDRQGLQQKAELIITKQSLRVALRALVAMNDDVRAIEAMGRIQGLEPGYLREEFIFYERPAPGPAPTLSEDPHGVDMDGGHAHA